MSTLSAKNPTLVDVTRILDPQGKIDRVANILQQYNEIVDDIPMVEGNLPTGHMFTKQTSKPSPYFRLLNEGIVPQKATTGQVTESCAIMENRNQIDKDLAELNGNTVSFRASQDRPMIEGFSDTLADTLFNGDVSVDMNKFNGLTSRYFSLGTTYATYGQIIDAGGTGSDNTSIYLVGWSPETVFGIYPKGSKAGLQYEDLGLQEVTTDATTGARMRAYESWMQWKFGLCVRDYRYVVRICNIDYSALLTASDTGDSSANLLKYLSMALDALPPGGNVKKVFYMNNKVQAMLRVKLLDKGNLALSLSDVMSPSQVARKELSFFGAPCRRVETTVITNAEARITTATT